LDADTKVKDFENEYKNDLYKSNEPSNEQYINRFNALKKQLNNLNKEAKEMNEYYKKYKLPDRIKCMPGIQRNREEARCEI
jgi:hypothetical protein